MQDFNNHTQKNIHELYRDITDGRLILQPDFQRRLVWSNKHRIELIDTILKGYPFPEIYIADRGIDIDNITSERVVVDGQQRMHTICSYIDGKVEIGPKDIIKPYVELSDNEKKSFLAYGVNVCQIYGAEQDDLKEIFRRINLTKYPLNDYEINNAVYDGGFMSTAKRISQSINWDGIPAFKASDIARMREIGFVLTIMSTIEEGGYFNNDDAIAQYVEKYNDAYPNADNISHKINHAFDFVDKLKLSTKSMWNKKSNFFTLIIMLTRSYEIIEAMGTKEFKNRLTQFEAQVVASRTDNTKSIYSDYSALSYTGTNKRSARIGRAKIFEDIILSN